MRVSGIDAKASLPKRNGNSVRIKNEPRGAVKWDSATQLHGQTPLRDIFAGRPW